MGGWHRNHGSDQGFQFGGKAVEISSQIAQEMPVHFGLNLGAKPREQGCWYTSV